ncbi:hypothetical protein ACTWPT_53610 [Nonomuraea sp. 3N208]|uniref:hypothetical protein n=1 Tax=Nonomuraea sp. 3N208 TaxID=3457421 RepID=UPI003FD642D3
MDESRWTWVLRVLRGRSAAGRALHDGGLWVLLSLPPALWVADSGASGPLWREIVLPLAALGGAVAVSRWRPLLALAVCVALTCLDPLSPVDRYTLSVAVMSFLAGRRVPGAARALSWIAAMVGLTGPAGLLLGRPAQFLLYDLLVLPLVTVIP